jgi:2-polyprenyl-3-methyl-5-hydroxy-6-metoxy-1,4-benzoquinol methylase
MQNESKSKFKSKTINPELHYGDMFERDKYVRQRYELYLNFLSPYLKQDIKILDIGGYRGELKDLLPKDIKYYLVDFDAKALAIAEKKGAKTKKLNFDEESISWTGQEPFDIIVATEVFEHLKDPRRHLKEIQKILKPDGVVLVSLPNENMLYHRIMSLLGFGNDYFAFKLYKHLHLPTIKQSREFLSTTFQIMKEDYYINVGAQSSRVEFLGKFFTLIPDQIWNKLAHFWPSGFARGTVFLLKKK